MGKEDEKQIMLEEVITNAVKIPGVKVNRAKFLAEQFADKSSDVSALIEKGPIEVGVEREEINKMAKKIIIQRTSQSSIASFVAGIPGGLAMAATIPADILQFFGMALKLAQELSYLYGAEDLWNDGKLDDEKVRNQLILYCGVMFGVSGAVSGVRVLSTQISKVALKKIPQQALTKTFWYPIIKKILSAVGIKITKKTVASGVSKAVPIIGGVISGGLNFASMMPMANRLNDTLDKATFDYSDEEFNKDIEILLNPDQYEEIEEEDSFKDKVSNFVSKIGGKKENKEEKDPYEEVKKLKELLDNDIISKEEFEKKKKELLGL